MLQIQAAQVDNPLKAAQARVEVEVLDLNDNLPEFEVDFYNISIVENLPNGKNMEAKEYNSIEINSACNEF